MLGRRGVHRGRVRVNTWVEYGSPLAAALVRDVGLDAGEKKPGRLVDHRDGSRDVDAAHALVDHARRRDVLLLLLLDAHGVLALLNRRLQVRSAFAYDDAHVHRRNDQRQLPWLCRVFVVGSRVVVHVHGVR